MQASAIRHGGGVDLYSQIRLSVSLAFQHADGYFVRENLESLRLNIAGKLFSQKFSYLPLLKTLLMASVSFHIQRA